MTGATTVFVAKTQVVVIFVMALGAHWQVMSEQAVKKSKCSLKNEQATSHSAFLR